MVMRVAPIPYGIFYVLYWSILFIWFLKSSNIEKPFLYLTVKLCCFLKVLFIQFVNLWSNCHNVGASYNNDDVIMQPIGMSFALRFCINVVLQCTTSRFYKSQFPQSLNMFVCNNACLPHIYCLNWEPYFFQQVKFIVDCFHWPGQPVGFSMVYFLDIIYADRDKLTRVLMNRQILDYRKLIDSWHTAINLISNFKRHG